MSRLPPEPPSSEITPKALYLSRREFLKNSALTLGTASVVGSSLVWLTGNGPPPDLPETPASSGAAVASLGLFDTDEEPTSHRDVTTHNNFYEYGTQKADPARNAHLLKTKPW